jgi:cytochrome c5
MYVKILLFLLPLFAIISCAPVAENSQPGTTKTDVSTVAEQATETPEPTATNPIQEAVEAQATATPLLPTATFPSITATIISTSGLITTTSEVTPQNQAGNEDLAMDGLRVYKEQYCGLCHELAVAETKGLFGPAHNQVATNAVQHVTSPDYSGNATDPAGYIRESIRDPGIHLVEGFELSRHKMPAYTHLSDEDVEALVQFLLQQQ